DAKQKPWQHAPHLLEDHYTFADALVVGSLALTLIKHADRIKIGCLAQLINVIAPIMTNNQGTPTIWYQSIFYPFMQVANYAQGTSLKVNCEVADYTVSNRVVPYVSSSAVYNQSNGEVVLFIENKAAEEANLSYKLANFPQVTLKEATQFAGYNLDETNEKQTMQIETLKDINVDNQNCVNGKIAPYSWNMICLSVASH
ncbi:MAG: alpha-N-arabinofuranosidase, partial [Bombilactobacillus sp.]|nr:alpha-N-arabinofuranosidase [Bombilactobacillus sp.]